MFVRCYRTISKCYYWRQNICIDSFSYFSHLNRPTFKTATLNSRTQLKQQLQREQLQELERQELERRENERKLSSMPSSAGCTSVDHNSQIAHSSHATSAGHQLQVPRNCTPGIPQLYASSPTPSTSTEGSDFASGHFSNQSNPMQHADHSNAPLKVPLHIGVDLPPQVLKASNKTISTEFDTKNTNSCCLWFLLQVRTVLANPTRYHVIQKQKNQVRQYLSESFQQSEWNDNQQMQQLQHQHSKQEVTCECLNIWPKVILIENWFGISFNCSKRSQSKLQWRKIKRIYFRKDPSNCHPAKERCIR